MDPTCDHVLSLCEGQSGELIDGGIVVTVECTECGAVGEAAIDLDYDVTWIGSQPV